MKSHAVEGTTRAKASAASHVEEDAVSSSASIGTHVSVSIFVVGDRGPHVPVRPPRSHALPARVVRS